MEINEYITSRIEQDNYGIFFLIYPSKKHIVTKLLKKTSLAHSLFSRPKPFKNFCGSF